MNIFKLLFRNKGDDIAVSDEIKSWIETYEKEYCTNTDEENIIIFKEAKDLISSFDNKTLKKQLLRGNVNTDLSALNVIQNMAMVYVQNGDIKDIIKQYGETHTALNIYRFANQKKLDLHYISPLQYEENEKLIQHIYTRLL